MPPRRSAFKAKYSTAQGYADHFPFDQNQEMMETLKGLKRGDIVTIRFTTDFERHRIESIRKREDGAR